MGSLVILSIFLVEVRVLLVVTDNRRPRHPQHLPRGGEGFVVIDDGQPRHPQHLPRGGEGFVGSH